MRRPQVTLKLATSLDGRIAAASGESRWITGEAARAAVQQLRAAHDAVMIGAETARQDNPSLLACTTPPPARQPARVVLTTRLDIAPDSNLFADIAQSPLFLFGAERASPARHAILEGAGARVEQVASADGRLDLNAVLARLGELGITRVLTEGGGKLAASLIAANVVDRLEWMRAPIVLGGEGQPAVAPLNLQKLADAPAWRRVALRELGSDLWESYERVS